MTVRKAKGPKRVKSRRGRTPTGLEATLRPHAAGIDVHSREHWVYAGESEPQDVAAAMRAGRLPAYVRKFGTCTADLEQLADWLTECGIKTVAMESTGVY